MGLLFYFNFRKVITEKTSFPKAIFILGHPVYLLFWVFSVSTSYRVDDIIISYDRKWYWIYVHQSIDVVLFFSNLVEFREDSLQYGIYTPAHKLNETIYRTTDTTKSSRLICVQVYIHFFILISSTPEPIDPPFQIPRLRTSAKP